MRRIKQDGCRPKRERRRRRRRRHVREARRAPRAWAERRGIAEGDHTQRRATYARWAQTPVAITDGARRRSRVAPVLATYARSAQTSWSARTAPAVDHTSSLAHRRRARA